MHLRLTGLALAFALSLPALAQPFPPSLFGEMRWRSIGPFRGGRAVAASGVPGQPNVFYTGVNNGGVWRSNDYGRTWRPIFDGQPTQSIGALAVAPSKPATIYVGSGEGLLRPDLSVGDGLYKSTDAGGTWRHLGLRDAQQIAAIAVHPKDPDRLFVAALGHPYGPNEERGVFRSTDGGETYQKVLYKDSDTGAADLAFDPSDPETVYAVLWQARLGPWENSTFHGPGSGLHKSTDGGSTWRPLTKGLPTFAQGLDRIGIGTSASRPKRLFAMVQAGEQHGGVYRSDDAGESWRRVNDEKRLWGRGDDFAEVRVDPKDAEVVYVANTAAYRSTDGGATFVCFKGAPGGDDYHRLWINPENPDILLFATDQGTVVSVNRGETWSSWYNQPTAQLYHVSTDDRWPYWVYGGQQESGSAAVASRGDYGAITVRDWKTVGAEEYGYVAVDPRNPDLVYGGKLTRFSHSTGDAQDVAPEPVRTGQYRFLRTAPVLFSPADPRVLFYAGQVLFKTTDGGRQWEVISPDLSREAPEVSASVGVYRTPEVAKALRDKRRGVIYTVAPSPLDANLIWAGTDDGLMHVSRDGGKTWTNVTPPALDSWSKVSLMEASRFDRDVAYAAINRIRLDDPKPHVLRTRDGGKTWVEIVNGLAEAPVNSVREDPLRKGLLYAGTERGVAVSFDDGERWQPLQLNLPATSVRDLVVHGDDLVVGTHGRGFWILDDVTPLRQLTPAVASDDAHLFTPQLATRVRRSKNTDTPLPPDEPMGQNPPDGAVIDYALRSAAKVVTLEVLDAAGRLVRRYASDDVPPPVESGLRVPHYWIRPPRVLSTAAGMHRFVWDLRAPEPAALSHEYPIAAIPYDTPRAPEGAAALPGDYTVRLTVDGKTLEQPLKVRMDPRVTTSAEELRLQHATATRITEAMRRDVEALERWRVRSARLPEKRRKEAEALRERLTKLNEELATLLGVLNESDAEPTPQAVRAAGELEAKLAAADADVARL